MADVTQTFSIDLKATDSASAAVQQVTAELQKLGSGTSLAGLEAQLKHVETAFASTAQHVPALTDAVKAGFSAMEEAASYGTAAIVDTIRTASVEQLAAMKEGLAEESAALKEALAAQVEARKEAAREGAEGEKGGFLGGLGEHLEKPLDLAKTVIGFEAGMAAISAFTEGIHEMPRAFMEAAQAGETFTAQMHNFYGSTQAAGQVLDWTNQQALKMPFSLDAIRQSTAALAETGQDASKLLPALGNIASAMGTDLPTAAQAFDRALTTGNLRGLQSTFHLSRAELEQFGLQADKSGKIVTSTLAPALERLAAARFGDAMARQGATAQGGLQRIANAFDLFKESAGEGLAKGLAGPLKTVTDWISTHQSTIQRWGQAVGEAMAKAGAAAVWLAEKLGPPIGAAIGFMVSAWNAAQPAVSTTIGVITTAMGQIGTFLHDQVLPVVLQVLSQMAGWWDAHAKQIGQILGVLWGVIQTFWGSLQANMSSALNILHGVWEIGWGLISGEVGMAIDLITGNFKQFGQDLKNIAGNIAEGVVDIFAGMVERAISIMAHLEDPITQLSADFFRLSSSWAGAIYDAFIGVQQTVTGIINDVIGSIDTAITKIDQTFQSKTISIVNPITHKRQVVAQTPGLDIGTIAPLAMPTASPGDRTTFMQSFGLGKEITFGATGDQAVAAVEKTRKGIDADIRKYLGMPSAQQEGKAGQSLWDSITGLFGKYKAQSLGLSAGDQAALGSLPALVSGAGGAAGATADPTQALRTAYDAATKHLQADITRNLPGPVLMRDREAIHQVMLKEQKAGMASADDIFLEMNSSLQAINDHVHQQGQDAISKATQVLQWDQILKLPQSVLLAQVNRIMKDYAQSGVTPGSLEYRAVHQQLLNQINGSAGAAAQAVQAPPPRYGSYAGLAGASYGQSVVSFGGPAQTNRDAAIIAGLQHQLAAATEQITHLKALLAQGQQVASNTKQIVVNTQATADKMDQPGRGTPPAPAPSVGGALRGRGIHYPIPR